jgi:MFS family permease
MNSQLYRYYAFTFLSNFVFFGAVLIPFYTDWGGISLARVQLLQSWFSIWMFVLEVPTGAVADYLGRKVSIGLGAAVMAIGAILYASIPAYPIFLAGEFLFAVAMSLVSGADQALLYDTLKSAGREKESQRIFGIAHSVKLGGVLLAALFGSLIAQRFGLNAPMLFSAVPMLLAALIAFTIIEPKNTQAVSESKRYLQIVKEGFSSLRSHRPLRLLAVDAILVSIAGYFVIWLNQALLQQLDIPVGYFGITHALLMGSEILVAANFTRLVRLFGSTVRYLRLVALMTAAVFFLAALFPSIPTVLLLLIIGGGFGMTRMELMLSHMNRLIPSGQRATTLSSISMFRRLSLAGLNPLIGLAGDFNLSYALVLVGLLPLAAYIFSPLRHSMFDEKEIV